MSLLGTTIWFKFYNNAETKKIVNIAAVESLNKVFIQFTSGIYAFVDDATGEILEAKQLAGMGAEDGDYWHKGGVLLTDDESSIFSMVGTSISTTSDYLF